MNEGVVSLKHLHRFQPTLDTPFHIDQTWWEQMGRDLRVELRAHLCAEHRAIYAEHLDSGTIDWVDPRTGEVTRVDGLQHLIREHCSRQPEYLGERVSLVDVVFRVFLANGNRPLNAQQLAQMVGRSAETILRTLSGRETYKGLRPVVEG